MINEIDFKGVHEDFRGRLCELCEETEKKKSDLPREIGIDYSVFSFAVNHGIVPRPLSLQKIADFFNVSIEYLLCETDELRFSKAKTPKTFHQRFDELRKQHGLTYYAIGKKLHIGKSTIGEWNRKKYIPELNNLILLKDLFDVSLDYLLGRTDEK